MAVIRPPALHHADPATYARHALHGDERVWVEKNCYVDIWIEVIHALALDPMAILPFTVAVDFEGDQWTFFKPPHTDLRDLYGIDVQELNVWRPLLDHAMEHLGAGKLISTEADAFWLPDTAGTDYRRQHTKTTIVLAGLDVEGQRLTYFHNASLHALEGEDFVRTFRVGAAEDPTFMPLFAEIVKTDRLIRHPYAELRALAMNLLRRHFEARPAENPLIQFQERFEKDLPLLQERGLAHYHAWAFATVRQLGAAFELAALFIDWLGESGSDMADARAAFHQIATGAKTLILKAARSVNSRRPFDGSLLTGMAASWDAGMHSLARALAGARAGRA